jgi:hypothetical protein
MWRLVGRRSAALATARQAEVEAARVLTRDLQRRLFSKVYNSSAEAIHDVGDGSTMSLSFPLLLFAHHSYSCSICGGFGLCGVPENLLRCVGEKGVK